MTFSKRFPARFSKSSMSLSRALALASVAVLGSVSLSCNDSGNAAYPNFNPTAQSPEGTHSTFGAGSNNADNGLANAQQSLVAATSNIRGAESKSSQAAMGNQFAATADLSGHGKGMNSDGPANSGATAGQGGSLANSSLGASSGAHGGGGAAGGSSGSGSTGFLSGDVGMKAIDPNATAAGDGSNANGLANLNASDAQGAYATGSGGGGSGKAGAGGGGNFSGLFGENGSGGGNGKAGDLQFDRSPASASELADGLASTGTDKDPENYFQLVNPSDNLFKIVERRYVFKSKQWALRDAMVVRQSVLKAAK